MKLLVTKSYRTFLVRDESKDYHTNFGFVKADELSKAKPGDIVQSNKGEDFFVMEASFIDMYGKIKRGAQIIPRKDLGLIITETGLGKDSVVIETGAGSGAVGLMLSRICKKVYAYEIREDYVKLVKANIEFLGIKNYNIKLKDAKLGFKERNADVIILDLPWPWELCEVAKKSLKFGGFLISYSPTIPQTMDFVNKLDNNFIHVKTSEIIEREWEISDRKVRPRSQAIGHSGFISIVRRVS